MALERQSSGLKQTAVDGFASALAAAIEAGDRTCVLALKHLLGKAQTAQPILPHDTEGIEPLLNARVQALSVGQNNKSRKPQPKFSPVKARRKQRTRINQEQAIQTVRVKKRRVPSSAGPLRPKGHPKISFLRAWTPRNTFAFQNVW